MSMIVAAVLAVGAAGAGPPPVRVDHFGDPLPAGARFRIGTTRLQHGQAVHALALSPDGKLLGSAGHDTVALWDVATGREVRRLSGWGSANIHVIAFTADGQAVAVNTLQELILVDTITGNVRAKVGTTASHCTVAPDGKTLTAVQWDGDAMAPLIRTWDLATALPRHSWKYRCAPLKGGGQPAVRFCLSADGRTLAAVEVQPERTQLVRLHDTATGRELHRWQTTELQPVACTLSRDRKLLATGAADGTVRVWEVATGKELRRWHGDAGTAASDDYAVVDFAPDGATLFCRTMAGLVRRDWRTGETLRTYPDTFGAPVLLTDGKTMAVRGPVFSIRLLDIATGAERCPLPRAGSRCAISPDSRFIASTEAGVLIVSDLATGAEVYRRAVGAIADSPLAFAPDGKAIATVSPDLHVRVWEIATGREVQSVQALHRVTRLVFSREGRRLAGGHASDVSLWEVATGKLLDRWTDAWVVMAPDLGAVASANRTHGTLRLRDTASGKLLHTLAGYRAWVRYGYTRPGGSDVGVGAVIGPRFSPDGRLLLTGGVALRPSDRDALYLWDTATGRRTLTLPGDTTILSDVAFAPDNRLLALMRTDCSICLVNPALGTTVRTLSRGKDRMAATPVFTPDGRTLVTVVGDLIQVWEVATGGEICQRTGQRGGIHTLTMSPDGRSLAMATYDQTILVWDLVHLVPDRPRPAALWEALGSGSAARGRAAIQGLAAAPAKALPLLRERLAPLRTPDAKQVARWIAELDSDEFETRQHAEAELDRYRDAAAVPLQQALGTAQSLEARRRIEGLLRKRDLGMLAPDELRRIRALQALELIGTPEAQALMRSLTGMAAHKD